ncbi:hypothetical protein ES332_A04G037000v1 [Gossypium tomentosum]|uniref:Uncharacterized protein n=1 Tax=Gossypium tomentosum TaxID=34277 RepID=A0A5D2QXD1_GOSTO|nr:hypothetical protein ES332_A04G037000v1 [Gossypium tomentosum]
MQFFVWANSLNLAHNKRIKSDKGPILHDKLIRIRVEAKWKLKNEEKSVDLSKQRAHRGMLYHNPWHVVPPHKVTTSFCHFFALDFISSYPIQMKL